MHPQQLPFVSVIVPTLNDDERLRCCLDALADQTYPRDRFEVIVVDNGAITPPMELVERYPFTRLLQESKRGSYAARNLGVVSARGELLAFTDSDCRPAPTWLKSAVSRLDGGTVHGIVAGRVRIDYERPGRPTGVEVYDAASAFPQRQYVAHDHFGVTANLVTRREVMRSVGPFNASLQSGGDLEWGRRAHELGYGITYDADVIVAHPARRTIGALTRKLARVTAGVEYVNLTKQDVSGRKRSLIRQAVPPVGMMMRVLQDRHLGPAWPRVKGAAIVLYARYARLFFRVRHLVSQPRIELCLDGSVACPARCLK